MGAIVALGVDAGSTTLKVAGVDAAGALVWHRVEAAEPLVERQARELVALARAEAGAEAVPLVATGYGRRLVEDAVRIVTEITCHGRGVFHALGLPGTLVDIGGQDSKVIRIGPGGAVMDFAMNDKCAAGTGRFLENTAMRLRVPLENLAEQALSTEVETPISSTCTVFAESEIISLVAHATPVPSILRGLHRSLVRRVAAMVRTVGVEGRVFLSGGVALNQAVRLMLAQELGVATVTVPPHPQLMGAYGAALMALANSSNVSRSGTEPGRLR